MSNSTRYTIYKKQACHEEVMELKHQKIEIEQQRIQMTIDLKLVLQTKNN